MGWNLFLLRGYMPLFQSVNLSSIVITKTFRTPLPSNEYQIVSFFLFNHGIESWDQKVSSSTGEVRNYES